MLRLPPSGGAPTGRGYPGHGRFGAACSAAFWFFLFRVLLAAGRRRMHQALVVQCCVSPRPGAEPAHKRSGGPFVAGEGPGLWPGAACSAAFGFFWSRALLAAGW